MSKESRLEFYTIAKSADIVWIGEVHGISQNYLIYKFLIPSLQKIGFSHIALEYPPELNAPKSDNWRKFINYQDGRFSQEALSFFQWLLSTKISFGCFDDDSPDQQDREYKMAQNMMKISSGAKTIVISGGFHSQKRTQMVNGRTVLPQSGVVEQITKNRIVRLGIKYFGGKFINFGLKKITSKFLNYDELKLQPGEFSRNINPLLDEEFWIHAGPATPVHQLAE